MMATFWGVRHLTQTLYNSFKPGVDGEQKFCTRLYAVVQDARELHAPALEGPAQVFGQIFREFVASTAVL